MQLGRAADDRHPHQALRIVLQMKENGVRPDIATYNHLLRALADEGMCAEAWAVAEDMQLMGINPDRSSCHYLMHVT
jgi:pentatricopeptide repeat protein